MNFHDYNKLTMEERCAAIEDARQQGHSAAFTDRQIDANDGRKASPLTFLQYVINPAIEADLMSEDEAEMWTKELEALAGNDPRTAAFISGYNAHLADMAESARDTPTLASPIVQRLALMCDAQATLVGDFLEGLEEEEQDDREFIRGCMDEIISAANYVKTELGDKLETDPVTRLVNLIEAMVEDRISLLNEELEDRTASEVSEEHDYIKKDIDGQIAHFEQIREEARGLGKIDEVQRLCDELQQLGVHPDIINAAADKTMAAIATIFQKGGTK